MLAPKPVEGLFEVAPKPPNEEPDVAVLPPPKRPPPVEVLPKGFAPKLVFVFVLELPKPRMND